MNERLRRVRLAMVRRRRPAASSDLTSGRRRRVDVIAEPQSYGQPVDPATIHWIP